MWCWLLHQEAQGRSFYYGASKCAYWSYGRSSPSTTTCNFWYAAWAQAFTNLHWGALLLLSVNIICVNLAGVATFLFQGVRPRTWWEENRAKKSTRIAIFIWTLLLLILIVIISHLQNNFF